jgi:hypothetical protein
MQIRNQDLFFNGRNSFTDTFLRSIKARKLRKRIFNQEVIPNAANEIQLRNKRIQNLVIIIQNNYFILSINFNVEVKWQLNFGSIGHDQSFFIQIEIKVNVSANLVLTFQQLQTSKVCDYDCCFKTWAIQIYLEVGLRFLIESYFLSLEFCHGILLGNDTNV